MSQPWGAGRWMLDQVSAVRASACVFKAKVSARSALCYFFSPPNSAIFLLCFAFHLLECVYWFSVMQTAIKQDPSNALEPTIEYAPNNLNTNRPINPTPQQQYNIPVINQPLSPVPDSQSLLRRPHVPAGSGQAGKLGSSLTGRVALGPRQFKECGRARSFLSGFTQMQDAMKNRAGF